MLFKTRGIVLRSIAYGETSIITTIYTELFGIQSYIAKNVRRTSKREMAVQASMFQPAAILNMVVYHQQRKQLQIIKECKWAHLYKSIYGSVIKNCISLFITELITKTIKQPESNASLFNFLEEIFLSLDEEAMSIAANLPLYFSLHLARYLGFGIDCNTDENESILDIREGRFTNTPPAHGLYLNDILADATANLLKIKNIKEIYNILLSKSQRQQLLHAYEQFYLYHISDFSKLKTLPILQTVLEAN